MSAIAAFFLAGWHRELTLETIKERRDWLKGQVEDHLVLSAAIYFGVYVLLGSLGYGIYLRKLGAELR